MASDINPTTHPVPVTTIPLLKLLVLEELRRPTALIKT